VRPTPHTRHQAVQAARTQVFRIEEEQVLEVMGEPRAPLYLPCRADVERQRHGDDGIRAVHVQHHVQAVLQLVLLVGDVDSATCLAGRTWHVSATAVTGTQRSTCSTTSRPFSSSYFA